MAAGEIFEGYFVGIDFAQTVQVLIRETTCGWQTLRQQKNAKRAGKKAVTELIDTALILSISSNRSGKSFGRLRVGAGRPLWPRTNQRKRRRWLYGRDERRRIGGNDLRRPYGTGKYN